MVELAKVGTIIGAWLRGASSTAFRRMMIAARIAGR